MRAESLDHHNEPYVGQAQNSVKTLKSPLQMASQRLYPCSLGLHGKDWLVQPCVK